MDQVRDHERCTPVLTERFFVLMIRRQPRYTLFPYTTLFRSKLESADIVFWIGEEIETFLEKPLDTVAIRARKVSFMESDDIQKIKFRENSIFDEHDDHDDHEEHDDHDKHDDHGHQIGRAHV